MLESVFVMNSFLVASNAAVGIASDLTNGVIDRLRSLPIVKSAILGGTTLSNTIRSLAALAAMLLIGFLVGFRPNASLGAWLGAVGLLNARNLRVHMVDGRVRPHGQHTRGSLATLKVKGMPNG